MKKFLYRISLLLLLAAFVMPADMTLSAAGAPEPSAAAASAAAKKKSRRKSSSKSNTGKKKSRKKSSSRYRRASGSGVGVAPTFTTTDTPGKITSAERPGSSVSTRRKITVEKPDLDYIKRVTLDPNSEFYFPRLMAKYNRNDTTMTQEEYRNLYLGYVFQEDYDPYRTSQYSGITDALREKKEHSKEEIDTIKKYAELTLRDNPFDLRQMSFLVHVLKERRKDMSAKIWEYRLEHLLGAIKSTGTGEDEENAFYVIYPMHEYDLIQLMGYEATDVDFIEPGYDFLTVRPDEETAKRLRDKVQPGFYFNVELLTDQYEKKHPEALEAESESDSDDDADNAPAVNTDETPATDTDEIPAE